MLRIERVSLSIDRCRQWTSATDLKQKQLVSGDSSHDAAVDTSLAPLPGHPEDTHSGY